MRKLYGTLISIEECYSECNRFTIVIMIEEKYFVFYCFKRNITTITYLREQAELNFPERATKLTELERVAKIFQRAFKYN